MVEVLSAYMIIVLIQVLQIDAIPCPVSPCMYHNTGVQIYRVSPSHD